MMIFPVLVFIIIILTTKYCFCLLFSLVVALVPGRSQVIALRWSYNYGCRRKHIRWSLV
jgi:hypothetical protein